MPSLRWRRWRLRRWWMCAIVVSRPPKQREQRVYFPSNRFRQSTRLSKFSFFLFFSLFFFFGRLKTTPCMP